MPTPQLFQNDGALRSDLTEPNARVWQIYRDRVKDLDKNMLDSWHKTLDLLLIFIGLFLAVVTAFIIESSKRLQPDFSEITAKGVVALLAQANPSFVTPALPSFDTAEKTTRGTWINALWFTSFTLALVDALLAILAKQWLGEYDSKQLQPAANVRQWAWRHRIYRSGLDRWGVGAFISSLSVILYTALYLFLAGLLIFLFELDLAICAACFSLSILVTCFHIGSTLAPLWWGACPSTTPLLKHLYWIGARIGAIPLVDYFVQLLSYIGIGLLLAVTLAKLCLGCLLMISRLPLTILWICWKSRQGPFDGIPWNRLKQFFVPAVDMIVSPAYDGARLSSEGSGLHHSATVLLWMTQHLLTDPEIGAVLDAVAALDEQLPVPNDESRQQQPPQRDEAGQELSFQSDKAGQDEAAIYRYPIAFDPTVPQRIIPGQENTTRHSQADDKMLFLERGAALRTFLSTGWKIPLALANDWLDRRVSLLPAHMAEVWATLPARDSVSPTREGLIKWSFLLANTPFADGLRVDLSVCQHMYWVCLNRSGDADEAEPWPSQHLELGLSCLHFRNARPDSHWRQAPLLSASNIIRETLWLRDHRKSYWSAELHGILRGFFHQCSHYQRGDTIMYHLDAMLVGIIQEDHNLGSDPSAERGDLLRLRPISMLRREGNQISTWEEYMNIDVNYRGHPMLAKQFATELAILSDSSLSALLSPDDNLGILLEALAGGRRGVDLALRDPRVFVELAFHGRKVSENSWWATTKQKLLLLTEEEWEYRQKLPFLSGPPTPQALVDAVESHPPCGDCAISIERLQKTVAPAPGSDGVTAPLDTTSSSVPKAFRRIFKRSTAEHHRPGDTEMQITVRRDEHGSV